MNYRLRHLNLNKKRGRWGIIKTSNLKTCQTRLFHFWVIWKLTYFIFETFCSRNRKFLEIFPQKMRTKWIRLIWEDDGKRKKFAFKIAKKKKIPKMKISKIKNRSNQNLVSAKFKKKDFLKKTVLVEIFFYSKRKRKKQFPTKFKSGKMVLSNTVSIENILIQRSQRWLVKFLGLDYQNRMSRRPISSWCSSSTLVKEDKQLDRTTGSVSWTKYMKLNVFCFSIACMASCQILYILYLQS